MKAVALSEPQSIYQANQCWSSLRVSNHSSRIKLFHTRPARDVLLTNGRHGGSVHLRDDIAVVCSKHSQTNLFNDKYFKHISLMWVWAKQSMSSNARWAWANRELRRHRRTQFGVPIPPIAIYGYRCKFSSPWKNQLIKNPQLRNLGTQDPFRIQHKHHAQNPLNQPYKRKSIQFS